MSVAATPKESAARRCAKHPLDPLDRAELESAVQVLKTGPRFHERMLFVRVELREPPKQQVLAYPDGDSIDRQAFAVLLDPQQGATYEAVVSITGRAILSWTLIPGIQPPITDEEFRRCEETVRADPRFADALRRRGINDVNLVVIEGWTLGGFELPEDHGRRLVWTLAWARRFPQDNPYGHPIHGLHALVDLNRMEVIRIEDHGERPIAQEDANFTPEAVGTQRTDLKPLEVIQPEGASFELDGWEMRWQKWRFRIGFTPREGLVFHLISYDDGGRQRPIIYRASIAELVIPYGNPAPSGYRLNAFDIGEYGIGPYAHALERGCDCLGLIQYLDVDLCDNRGNPFTIKNAICIHEEDAGLLWKHLDQGTGHAEVRRSRRLVVSFIVTVGNYEYAFYWYFYLDGSIEVEVRLTGIVVTQALPPEGVSAYGTTVTADLMAPNHQHFFTARLDMMMDGLNNTVYEIHTESPRPGPENPYGGAFVSVATPLRTESEAQQNIDPFSARVWRIANPSVRNRLGQPVAYRLVPGGDGVLPFIRETSPVSKRIGFLRKQLWVTPYQPDERFPAGDYPNQHPEGDGLPVWTRQDRPIEDTDLVVWYTFVNHHIARPEDWPVMPAVRVGFTLKPDGFFDRNPSLDVPPPAHRLSQSSSTPL